MELETPFQIHLPLAWPMMKRGISIIICDLVCEKGVL